MSDGTFEAFVATVEAVVVGSEEDVVAGVGYGGEVVVGSAEGGVSGVGSAGECHFEVADGEVGV